ncbi:MAG: phage major tail tube protein [Caulobacter sp.]|nr:phage major tail tube protein [Caulobacter sp.]
MLPAKLRDMNILQDGVSFRGVATEVTPPKLTKKMESYRHGLGNLKLFDGLEDLDMEWTASGFSLEPYKAFGNTSIDGVQLRFVGAYQNPQTNAVQAVEITVRGQHEEIDAGNQKVGDEGSTKIKTACSYYKLTVDNVDVIEIDILNSVFVAFGEDVYANIRQAIGI